MTSPKSKEQVVPEDIMRAAEAVLNEWANGSESRPGPLIARAILAERERCAEYHDDFAAQHEAAIVDGSGNDHHVREARNHRRYAAAMRSLPTPPKGGEE